MESSLVLYKSTGLQSEKQFIIEDISSFLSTKVSWIYTSKYQYIKHGLNIAIKLNLSQSYLDVSSISDYDYLTIKNGTERMYFYFITGKRWLSTETVEFQLVMDTLNTFQWNVDYIVNKKTLVMREHKDRIIKRAVFPYFHFPLARNIPLRSEGINPPLYKIYDERIYQNDADVNWILYYRNRNIYDPSDPNSFTLDNPVDCFIAPNKAVKSKYASGNTTLLASAFTNDGYYYILSPKITLNNGGYTYSITEGQAWLFVKSSSSITIYRLYLDEHFNITTKLELFTSLSSIAIVENTYESLKFFYSSTEQNPWNDDYDSIVDITLSPSTTSVLLDPANIDRTDSRNIKIIELPYAPTEITYDSVNDIYLFDGNWEYDSTQKLFKLRNLETKFSSEIISRFNPLKEKGISREDFEAIHGEDSPADTDLREDILEGKIYHSDFYRPKFVYDSFFLTFQLENLRAIDTAQYDPDDNPFIISFVASSNVISKFLFMFPEYKTYYGTADFDNVVAVSRNNEQVIYNSQYLNYIRNGYNYDLKSKQRAEETGAIGLGISIASTILGVVGSVATGNYGMAAMSLAGGGLAIANQAVNYAKNVAQTEQNLEQKLQDSKMQSVNVLNADDIDLLNAYSGNKAKWTIYEVSPIMRKALLDMFYYAGYATNEQKIPSINTRYWFNYLQCDLVIDETNNLPESIIQDIKNRFKEGCTFFHHHTIWDIAQVKENYESWILS